MNILDQIIKHKKKEVEVAKRKKTPSQLIIELQSDQPHFSLRRILDESDKFHFICEIKKASPSKGIIQPNFDPLKQAKDYLEGGASAISILTDGKFFQGDLDHLKQVRELVSLPILRKDFIVDPYQIIESKVAGADIILLIARILTRDQIKSFKKIALELQLDIFVEIAEEKDLEKLDDFENVIIGINNRNLKTFEIDLNTSLMIKKSIPTEIPTISESGIQSVDDCLQTTENGFRGVLIGETLMRANNPKEILLEWTNKVKNVHQT